MVVKDQKGHFPLPDESVSIFDDRSSDLGRCSWHVGRDLASVSQHDKRFEGNRQKNKEKEGVNGTGKNGDGEGSASDSSQILFGGPLLQQSKAQYKSTRLSA